MEAHKQREETLEKLIDEHGIDAVLESLETVCYAKAEHLRANWQDARSARLWEMYAKRISRAW